MADNHIIIGLGGRGGDTLKAFRRILFKNSMTAKDPKEKVNSYPIQYLYLDSSSIDLNQGWDEELGIDYGIDDWARINTRKGVEFDDIKKNLSKYPTIRNWIGDESAWKKETVSTEVGSGQLRKLGRVYFAASVYNNGDNSFVKGLKLAHDRVTSISKSSEATNYHIIVGLSGGTGSGTIIDVIAQISKFIKESTYVNDKILIYAILPERNPFEGKDKLHFYHANAYAALKEINAIGLDKDEEANPLYYRPIDVMHTNRDGNSRINAKFTRCFLFSNENENSSIIDYDYGLPNMVGDFLFHRIINLPQSPKANDTWVKLTENSTVLEEIDKFTGKNERAIKFASTAIKRIEIPEIEVIDLYGARLLQQLINQQKYNNWEDNKGFLGEKGEDKTSDFVEKKGQDNFVQLCQITIDYLSLKTPHGIDDFKNSDDEWDTVSERLRTNALKVYTDGKEKLPIQFFRNYMNSFFDNQFRGNGMGVERYWAEKTKDIEQQSNYFYKKIEEQLLDFWVSKGGRAIGLNETTSIIERIIKELKIISSRASNRIGHLTDPNKFDVKDADFTNAGCNKEINKLIGDFGKFVNLNRKGTFETTVGFILKLYKNKTDVIAFQYAINLIDRLIKRLDELSSVITRMAEDLVRANESINEIISEKYKLFRSDDVSSYHQNSVEMLVPKGAVEREFKVIINEGDTVKEELREFRLYLKNKCANNTFNDLQKHFNSDIIIKKHLFYLNLRVPKIYESLQEKGKISPDDKLVGRNVLNYFQNEYKSMNDIENYFKSFVEKSGVYVRLDSANSNKIDSLGTITEDYGVSGMVIQYPSYPEDEDFEKKFKEMLLRVFPQPAVIEATKNNGKSNEITIFKARANFALRSFEMVSKMLRQKYYESYGINENMAALTLHTEKTGNDYPKLIPFDDGEKETEFKKVFDNELLHYFLLGYTLGFVEKIKDKFYLNLEPWNSNSINIKELSDSNSTFYGIMKYVFDNDINKQPAVQLQDRLTNILIKAIESFFNKRENTKEEIRKSWIDKMKNEIIPTIFKEDYEEDRTDKEYHLIVNAVEKVNSILNLK